MSQGIKFFTNPRGINHKFLLITLHDYLLKSYRMQRRAAKEILIDPQVYELKKHASYSWEGRLNLDKFLSGLKENTYFTADYPNDMNPKFSEEFIAKSWFNALKYKGYSQYIVSVQYKALDFKSFKSWFRDYNNLDIKSGILGLGNLCRIHSLSDFLKDVLNYAFKYCEHPRIHIYGLCLRGIPYAYNLSKKYKIALSVDSTKWTRAVNKNLKEKYGLNANNNGLREIFFSEYLKTLENRGVVLI